MNNTPLHVAKREWHGFIGSRPALIGTLAAGILLGLAGPFGTDEFLRTLPRIIYWIIVAVVTFLTGSIVDAILRPALAPRLGAWVALPLVALASSVAITSEIVGLNLIVFNFMPGPLALAILGVNVFAASLVITAALYLALSETREAPPETDAPKLMDRLPLAKRGALVSLSALDHYVEVTTTAGTELLLMRLSDAIAETDPVTGLQIHRSHWVALDAVLDVQRGSGKTELVLSSGKSLPVSRANLAAVKSAGLLPS